jgi:hypothetical protein
MLLVTREINQIEEELRDLSRNFSDTTFEIQEKKKLLQNELDQLKRCINTMKSTLYSVQVMDLVQPVRMMGIKCQGRAAVVMVYTLFISLLGLFQYASSGNISL